MTTDSRTERLAVDHGAIACRAYELYLARGCEDGCDVEDWLFAESQLLLQEASAGPTATGTWAATGLWPESTGGRNPIDIAKERYARGEISRDELEQIRQDLRKAA